MMIRALVISVLVIAFAICAVDAVTVKNHDMEISYHANFEMRTYMYHNDSFYTTEEDGTRIYIFTPVGNETIFHLYIFYSDKYPAYDHERMMHAMKRSPTNTYDDILTSNKFEIDGHTVNETLTRSNAIRSKHNRGGFSVMTYAWRDTFKTKDDTTCMIMYHPDMIGEKRVIDFLDTLKVN